MKYESKKAPGKRLMPWMRRSSMCLLAVVLVVSIGGQAFAGTDPCLPVRDAIGKLNSAVKFQQKGAVTYIATGKSYSSDYIAAGDREYSRRDDEEWKIDVRQPIALVIDSKAAFYECSQIGTDRLESASTVVYAYKRLTPEHIVRFVKIWIAESTGQPLRTEMTIGTEPDRKATFTFSYDLNAALPTVGNQ